MMATKKLYWENPYKTDFEARVIDVIDGKTVLLDQTYFYPESGGQPSDLGHISDYAVSYVSIENETVLHHLAEEMPVDWIGKAVKASVDSEKRFGYMQQHSGQHLLSATAYRLYGAHTVGMHIGEDYLTIDLDQKLSKEQVLFIENEANALIRRNLKIHSHFPDKEALSHMPLRKQPKVVDHIRVIEIEGYDYSPCGGTHLASTLEIGIIKIKRFDAYKTGIRIECVCGIHARALFDQYNALLHEAAATFSIKPMEMLSFATGLRSELESSREKINVLEEQLMVLEVTSLLKAHEDIEGFKVIRLDDVHLGMNALRKKCSLITDSGSTVVLAQSTSENKRHIVLQKSNDMPKEMDMNALFKAHLTPLGVKGGGNALCAQGGAQGEVNANEAFDAIEKAIESLL